MLCHETMLAFPDYSKPFEIHTDASAFALGAVISQNKKTIAFYSRKLNLAQTRYTTTERELLSIVETLKEFRTMLLGYKIIVWTDHKNLTCTNFNTERVLRWRLVVDNATSLWIFDAQTSGHPAYIRMYPVLDLLAVEGSSIAFTLSQSPTKLASTNVSND